MKKTLLLTFLSSFLAWNSYSQLNLSASGNPMSSYISGWTYGGGASPIDSTMRLTSAITGQNGYFYYASTYNTTTCPNFTVSFDFKISGSGANGLTFFFLSSPITPFSSGGTGAAIGLPSTTLNGISLIFDTKDDDANSNNPLVALYGFSNTASYTESNTTNLVGTVQANQGWMTDNTWHHVELSYSAGTLKVYLNNNATPQITGSFTLPNPTGYFGFTSSTSNTTASAHYVKSVSIKNAAPIHGTTTLCSTQTTTLVNAVSGGTWTSNNPTIASVNSTSGLVTAGTTSGTATITYTLPSACNSQTSSTSFTVNAVPSVNSIASQNICNGSTSTAVNFSGTPVGATYNWTNTNTAIGLPASGTGNIASFNGINTGIIPVSGTITVTPTLNGCTGSTKNYTYTINPTPTLTPPSSQTLCNGTQTTPVSFSGNVSGTTYSWTNTASSIGIPANGSGNISAFNALNSGSVPVIATVNVTPTANSCSGTPHSFTYTVNPTPSVNTISAQTACNNASVSSLVFTGTVGTTYSWSNNNQAIGLAGSGIGNLPTFTATNPYTAAIYATITVSPSLNGCTGSSKYFSFTVNPSPSINVISSDSVCNGATTPIIVFSGQIPTTSFNWTNTDTSIGLSATGTGNIQPFLGKNLTNTTKVATVTVTPVLNGCSGSSKNFTFTVFPTPTVSIPSDRTLCHGSMTSPIILSGSVAGTLYNWTNTKPSIGLPSMGNDTIPAFSATFAPVNVNQTSPVIATITVNPYAHGCLGIAQSFTMKVYPVPSINPVADQYVCNGLKSTNVNFTSNLLNTVFNWVTDNPTIGMADSGTGKLYGFYTVNTGNIPEVANITVTPDYFGCPGTPLTFSITVKPTPVMDTVVDQVICNNAPTTLTNFYSNVAGTDFKWYNTNNTIGLADSGIGNIPIFNAINGSVNPITTVIAVFPTANSCEGLPDTFHYKIKPTPNIIKPANQSICKGTSTSFVNFSGSVVGTTYAWTNTNTTIGLGAFGAGNIPSFVGVNSDTNAVTATVSVTPTANGCVGTPASYTYTINPIPSAPTIDIYPQNPSSVCANTQFQNFGTKTALRTDRYFTWSAINGNIMAVGKNNLNCLISFPYPAHAIVSLANTSTVSGCSNTATYDIDVTVNHVFVPTVVYHSGYFICLENDVENYYWGYDDVHTLDSTIIPNQNQQSFYEQNPDFANKYYWVIATKNGCWQKSYYVQPAGITTEIQKSNLMSVFPNPATDFITVLLSQNTTQNTYFKVYDVVGSVVKTMAVSDKTSQINIHELPTGVYFLSCYQNGIQIASSRFIKN